MLHARLAQVVLLGTWRRRKQAYVVCTRAEVQLFGDGLHERILGVQQTEEQLSGPRPPLFLLLSFDLHLAYFVRICDRWQTGLPLLLISHSFFLGVEPAPILVVLSPLGRLHIWRELFDCTVVLLITAGDIVLGLLG